MQSVPGVNATLSLSAGPVPRMGSPSMPPPPVPPGAMSNEAQLAAARRQAQIRAMQQQQHSDGNRQMSPPSGMPSAMSIPNVPGPSFGAVDGPIQYGQVGFGGGAQQQQSHLPAMPPMHPPNGFPAIHDFVVGGNQVLA